MMVRRACTAAVGFSVALWGGAAAAAPAQAKEGSPRVRATGAFDVKMSPLPDGETLQDLKVTRFAGDKSFKGDFEGSQLRPPRRGGAGLGHR
jgi:hypothetical protein